MKYLLQKTIPTIRRTAHSTRLQMIAVSYFLLSIFYSSVAFAQSTVLPREAEDGCINSGNCHLSDIPGYILYIANYLVGISGTITVLMVMYGGYQYITKDTFGKGEGMKTIMNALSGMVVTLFSYIIIKVLENLFNV